MARNRATANLTTQTGFIEPVEEAQHVERRRVWRRLWSTPCREQTWPGDGGRRGAKYPTPGAPPLVLLAARPRNGSTFVLIAWGCRLGDAQPLARKSKELARNGIAAVSCG